MNDTNAGPRLLCFGVFEVDLRTGGLRKHGLKVKLYGQPFQVLAMLLERPGELVTREEIREKLWAGNTFIDFEHSVNSAIKRPREALGDDPATPRFIETLPRRGYRFITAVDVGAGLVPAQGRPRGAPLRRHWIVVAAGGAAVAIVAVILGLNVAGLRDRALRTVGAIHESPLRIRSIAVLPLENLSRNPEQEYFADGMTDELITNLGKIGALRVISRTSVMRYKGTKKPLPEIARELNVDAIVEGTVRRSGDRVRITANLMHAPTDRHLWAKSYDRDLRDVLSLQGEVARAIAREIDIAVTPPEQIRLASSRPVNSEAHESYLKGLFHWYRVTPEHLETAREYFQFALEKDPSNAPVYAGLANVWLTRGAWGVVPPREAFAKGTMAASKALELDDTLAEGHAMMAGFRFYYEWDWPRAETAYQRAIQLNPNYADARAIYWDLLISMKRLEDARIQIERAVELDPRNFFFQALLGQHLVFLRRYDDAIVQLRKSLSMESNLSVAHRYLWGALYARGL